MPCGHLKIFRDIGADGLNYTGLDQTMVMYNKMKTTGNDIKADLGEIRCEDINWIKLVSSLVRWQAFLTMAMTFCIP
jgi:hypothetical protein